MTILIRRPAAVKNAKSLVVPALACLPRTLSADHDHDHDHDHAYMVPDMVPGRYCERHDRASLLRMVLLGLSEFLQGLAKLRGLAQLRGDVPEVFLGVNQIAFLQISDARRK